MGRVKVTVVMASMVLVGCASGVGVSVSATPVGPTTEAPTEAAAESAFGSLDARATATPEDHDDDPAQATAVASPTPANVVAVDVATEQPRQPSPETPSTTAPSDAAMAMCSSGAELLFRGRAEGPGITENGSPSTEGAAEAAICRFASGELEYHGVDVATGNDIRLPACQSAFNGWTAMDAGFTYVVTDRSEDDMGSPGILSRNRPDGGSTMWLLWQDIARDPELQTKPATPCAGVDPAVSAPTVFTSPTGNIACSMRVESVRCEIASHEWSLTPPAEAACDLDFGDAFLLTDEVAEPLCAGDTIRGGDAPELRYGESSVVGPFRCLSQRTGMTCTSEAGARLFLSKQDLEMTDAPGAES